MTRSEIKKLKQDAESVAKRLRKLTANLPESFKGYLSEAVDVDDGSDYFWDCVSGKATPLIYLLELAEEFARATDSDDELEFASTRAQAAIRRRFCLRQGKRINALGYRNWTF